MVFEFFEFGAREIGQGINVFSCLDTDISVEFKDLALG